jgi:predicted TIM-barrel fold metal-dependent hydrolase
MKHEQSPTPRWKHDEVFILDSTVHAYNTRDDNSVDGPFKARIADQLSEMLWRGHSLLLPDGDPKWALSRERFKRGMDAETLARALFAESPTDMCIYHGTPLYGIYKDGGSPLSEGKKMRDRWPGRVALYGPVSPWQPDALDVMDRLVEEYGVIGFKLYPMDLVNGRINSYRLDDPEIAFPLLERAQKLGIRNIATHKAIPQGQVPTTPFNPQDVAGAAVAFPDLIFEVVHGGFAFLEETDWQLRSFPNVIVNLEGSSSYLMQASPRRFAELIGTFLRAGGEDRVVWSTGCNSHHPRPYIDMFWDFQIPQDMVDGYGFPQLTESIKRKILGINHAKLLGWDIEAKRAAIAGDEFDQLTELQPPWGVRVPELA